MTKISNAISAEILNTDNLQPDSPIIHSDDGMRVKFDRIEILLGNGGPTYVIYFYKGQEIARERIDGALAPGDTINIVGIAATMAITTDT